MKWISFTFGLLGVVVLAIVGRFWQELLDSAEFKFIFFLASVSGPGGSSAEARQAASSITMLRAVPWVCYAGAALSLGGIGLVLTKGRVAAIPLLMAAGIILLPLGWVVISSPSLGDYLYAAFGGAPSAIAGLVALAVKGKRSAAAPHAETLPDGQSLAPIAAGTEKKPDRMRDKRLWAGGLAAAALCLLVAFWAARSGNESEEELLYYPGPVALSSGDMIELGEGMLSIGHFVAAERDGAWYAARVLSASPSGARVRFVGWDSDLDEELTLERMRMLPDDAMPQPPTKQGLPDFGNTTPFPLALTLSFYQPDGGLSGNASLAGLSPKQTRYARQLNLSDASLESALSGVPVDAGKPFALAATGTLRVDEPGKRYFAVDSNGESRLWIDDKPVESGAPVELEAGAHDLRLEHRHDGGSSLTLRLRTGAKPGVLRPLDLSRDGVVQAAREHGVLRLVLDESLLFDFDRAELKPSAERALKSIQALNLTPAPTASVTIEGHTDDRGASSYNVDLSRRRAETVRAWLSGHGATNRFQLLALGEQQPRVPNDTDAHRKLNRRVELLIGGDDNSPADVAALNTARAAQGAAAAPAVVPPTVDAPVAAVAGNQAVLDTVNTYYRELNDGTFDANRYFEPSVDRYITMTSTSTAAINNYIRNIFPKQFKQHHFELEAGTLAQEQPGQYVYVEHSRYIQAGKQNSVEKRVKVRLHVSPGGKIVSLHQFQRI